MIRNEHGPGAARASCRSPKWLALLVLALSANACSGRPGPAGGAPGIAPCQVVYDAGSSATRLYVYRRTASGWVGHRGPTSAALADPVRGGRGKTMSDAAAVAAELAAALPAMRHDGPPGDDGQPLWRAFDWRRECDIRSVAVYATGGMRQAEEEAPAASRQLWELLADRLGASFGMEVTTRTLSGYEEGLFAWLAVRQSRDDDSFGVAEMGGVSFQVAFPCEACEASRPVRVDGRVVRLFSRSLQGWGQDEAWSRHGSAPACAHGAGRADPGWRVADCVAVAGPDPGMLAQTRDLISRGAARDWYLAGAFRHMRETDVERFCRQGVDDGFERPSSCFRAVYLRGVLAGLGLPLVSEITDTDWTLGAVVCAATDCLTAP